MSLRSYSLLSACAVALLACGGPSRPGPLKHHFDDMYIARVPLEQKQSVLDAQQNWSIAKMELATARQQHEESVTEVKVAENEAKKAKLEKGSIKAKQKGAEKSGDLTQINAATLLARGADLAYKAATKKVEYMKARRKYLRISVDYHEDLMYEQEARYELSKARMAQSNNIQPRGFAMVDYQKQVEKRTRNAQRTKTRLDKAKGKVDRLEKEWKVLDKEARNASGSASSPPPPESFPEPPPPSDSPDSSDSSSAQPPDDQDDFETLPPNSPSQAP